MAKFDRDGRFLLDRGSAPTDPKSPWPNEWNTVHSIAISADRRLFVVDRGHRRFHVFDDNGNFLNMFTTGIRSSPYCDCIFAGPASLGVGWRNEQDSQVRPETAARVLD